MDKVDVCIVGAGVVGLAIARQLSLSKAFQNRSIVLLESESGFGQHTSSRNSEVIHAGIYYQENSLKAKLCVRGNQLLYEYCSRHHIPHRRTGKYIVAQKEQEPTLQALESTARANGVPDLQYIDKAQLQTAEPAVSAHSALHSPSTGIIDSHAYMLSLLHQAQQHGVEFVPFTTVEAITWDAGTFTVTCKIKQAGSVQTYRFQSDILINCAGLQASRLANSIAGIDAGEIPETLFCKGDYFLYTRRNPFQHLIYPLPDNQGAGLGIHATLDMAGQLRFGPDAEFIDNICYDIQAHKAQVFADAIRPYFPAICPAHLAPAYAGIRPRLAGEGSPARDFVIQHGDTVPMPGLIQLFGMESPGLTASLAIGEYVETLLQ